MAWATTDDVRAVTGWTSTDVSDAVVGSIITIAENEISARQLTGDSGLMKSLSIFLTAHYIELRKRGNEQSYSEGNRSVNLKQPTVWFEQFENIVKTRSGRIPYKTV